MAGAVAGPPGDAGFLRGLHAVALSAAVLYVLAAAVLFRAPASDPRSR